MDSRTQSHLCNFLADNLDELFNFSVMVSSSVKMGLSLIKLWWGLNEFIGEMIYTGA